MSQNAESHVFQAEIKQLLDIVVHSLYTEREIFLRELISNASDAMEKWRHLQAVEKDLPDTGELLEVRITTDENAGTLVIEDHGVGMTRDELVAHLGTIAHSGTRRFLEAAREQGARPDGVIGQFGVGFYSAFMVASRVRVLTRSWQAESEGLAWTSDGAGGFEITASDEAPVRGCRIELTLKDDAKEFATETRIEALVKNYSHFVGYPVLLNGRRINEVEALWLKNKSEVTDEEYKAFYQFTGKAWDEPMFRLHFSADAPIDLHALVFVPGENPERFGFGQIDPGVALYCRKILIDHQPPGLLPEWLRFLKGVIDSQDIPLNISRETMQDSALVRKIGSAITRRVIKLLESEATANPETYRKFHARFGRFLKEGVLTDPANRDALAALLRFPSTHVADDEPTGLDDYITRMREGQDAVYFLAGPDRAALEGSPYLEAFKARSLEVLFLTDSIDEVLMENLREYKGKKLVPAARAGLDLGEAPPTDSPAAEALAAEDAEALCRFIEENSGERVAKVAAGTRLTDSPAVALVPEDAMSPTMRRMMQAMDPEFKNEVKVELEINPSHPLIRQLAAARANAPETAALAAGLLLDNALMAAGLLEDPRETTGRINRILEKALS